MLFLTSPYLEVLSDDMATDFHTHNKEMNIPITTVNWIA